MNKLFLCSLWVCLHCTGGSMNSNMDDKSPKMKLFDSDEEEEDNYDDFKIRPQFQGPHGQQLLELSAQLPKRFKLDERFAEVFEPEYQEDAEDSSAKEIHEEKEKNIRILESVLGHEVPKSVDKNKSMKKQIRFDPDDENASRLVKNKETVSEKPKKSKKKKIAEEEKVEQPIPISTERYIEVCSDLKEVLKTATPFSFSQQFNHAVEEITELPKYTFEKISTEKSTDAEPVDEVKQKNESKSQMPLEKMSIGLKVKPKLRSDSFFITAGDPRLKEGVEFFKRPKPLEELRVEWEKRRPVVLELFRRKKKLSERPYQKRVQRTQNKFAVRKQNLKKFK